MDKTHEAPPLPPLFLPSIPHPPPLTLSLATLPPIPPLFVLNYRPSVSPQSKLLTKATTRTLLSYFLRPHTLSAILN